MSPAGLTLGRLLRMIAGLLVWFSAFVGLYAGLSVGCQHLAPAPEAGLINPVTGMLALIAVLHALALAALIAYWWKRPSSRGPGESRAGQRFRHRIEGLVLFLSLTGLVWIAFPVFMVPPCAG